MALMFVASKANILVYRTHSLKALYSCLRFFSSPNKGHNENTDDIPNSASIPAEPWLNIRAGIFGPDDCRLPLPGNVGMNSSILSNSNKIIISEVPKSSKNSRSLLDDEHLENLNESIKRQVHCIKKETNNLECIIQECPKLLLKDITSLFPDLNLSSNSLSVVTLCQKTTNDMSSWSERVETEREELMEQFVNSANKICELLIAEGYWADFIDPSSGLPYLGPFTNSSFFETDGRYKHLGFIIEDLGCCKVITHKEWGSHIFVGAIFTSAPVDCHILLDALKANSSENPQ